MRISVTRTQHGTPGHVGFSGTQSLELARGAMLQVQGTEGGLDRYVDVRWAELEGLRLVLASDPAELSHVEVVKRDGSKLSVPVRVDQDSRCALVAQRAIETNGGRSAEPVGLPLAGASSVEVAPS